MKKLIAIATVAAGLAFSPAQAAVLDFANEADTNGERALTNPGALTLDGVALEITSFDTMGTATTFDDVEAFFPYLDAGNAGLGVCQNITAARQCNPGNDDNITMREGVDVAFADGVARDILDLVFRDADHNLIHAMNDNGMVRIFTDNGTMDFLFTAAIAAAQGGDAFFQNTTFIGFDFIDTQFYVSAITVSDVPIPGAIPLLLSGLAGLGFASRKRKAA